MSAPKRPGAKNRAYEVRQARLDRRRVHRTAEQTAARQTRLARDCQHTHERRAAEQPEARQAKLERLCECNVKLKMLGFAQWNVPASL